jgi:SAM-dependent methyltransferase
MLRAAAARDAGVDWVRGDATRLPFRDQRFDAVVSTEAFHWFPDQAAALRELRRVLRPGGRLALTVVCPTSGLVGRLASAASRLAGEPFVWAPPEALRDAADAAGLVVERQTRLLRIPGALLLPPFLTVARRPRAGAAERSPISRRPGRADRHDGFVSSPARP